MTDLSKYSTKQLLAYKKKFEECKQYDVSIFNIVKYFQLCMDNNPNIIDSLFTPINCVLHSTQVGELVRERRKIFLHKGSYHKFLGYAHSQLAKATTKVKENKCVKQIWDFEQKHNISKTTNLSDIEQEMKERGIL